MLKIKEIIYFDIIVRPKASKERLGKIHDNALKVYVSSPAEDGRANIAVLKLLSSEFNIPFGNINIKNGTYNKRKTIEIEGLSKADLLRIIGG